jgi:hypothetical protein
MSEEDKPKRGETSDPPHVTTALGFSGWRRAMPHWDDGPDVVSSYNPLDALKKVPKFHE